MRSTRTGKLVINGYVPMKKYLALLVVALFAICGIFFFFFYRMGTNDAKALADFPVAYDHYDQAVSDYSKAVLATNPESILTTDDIERKADQALAVLHTKASVRISSLTKNDGDLMKLSLEIADLARQEVDTLKAYQSAVASQSADLDRLAKQFHDLTNQRQTDYAHYLELAGIKNDPS
jgi:hypothetical protein